MRDTPSERKTCISVSFWKLWPDLCLLWILLNSFIGLAAAAYDICRDDETNAYLACQPPMFDIIWYKTFNLTVSPDNATCGTPPSTFMQLGDRTGATQTCNASSPSLQHPPSFMIDDSSATWWQSINQPANSKDLRINITLAFNKSFLMAGDIIITFNSGRPDQVVLEKSTDNGVTWRPLQYYARNCAVFSNELVPGAAVSVNDPTAVTCTNRFAEVVTRPPAGQKLRFTVQDDRFSLFLGPNGADFQSFYTAMDNKLLDFVKFTDLRMRLIQPAVDSRGNNNTQYYGIADFQVSAWCDCNLHAAYCNYTDVGIVCDCQHNTAGKDCDSCLPLYNDRPWKRGSYLPYDTGTANECIQCECNDHALSCTYNATYGRGICEACLHNTRGYHCELCADTFYPNVSLPLSDLNRCVDCDCDLGGVLNNSRTCAQADNLPEVTGQCPCRTQVSGRRCDECVPGYYGLKDGPTPGNCTACNCTSDGTVGQSNVCQQSGGQCPCKPNIVGRVCDTCADGYFSFPTGSPQRDCLSCVCDKGGSTGPGCDKGSGQCLCRTNITGVKCNQVTPGNFVPMIDNMAFEPKSGGCEVTSDLYTPQNPFDGEGFAVCNITSGNVSITLGTIAGAMIQKDVQWPYIAAVRYSTSRSDVAGTLQVQVTGNTQVDAALLSTRLNPNISSACPFPAGSNYHASLAFTPGQSTASVSAFNNITLDIRCQYSLTLELYHYVSVDTGGNSTTNTTANGDASTNVTANGNGTTNVTGNGDTTTNVTANGNSTANVTANSNITTNVTANGNSTTNVTANGNSTTNGTANGNSTTNVTANGNSTTNVTANGNSTTNGTANSNSTTNVTANSNSTTNVTANGNSTTNVTANSNSTTNGTTNGTSSRKKRETLLDSGSPITIDSVVLLPGLSNTDGSVAFQSYAKSENQTVMQKGYLSCLQQVAALSTRQTALEQSPCKDLLFSLEAELYAGASACGCNPVGTVAALVESCQSLSGQCQCQPGVSGRTCDKCAPGYFNLTSSGCKPCNCHTRGAKNGDCNSTTGQCACHPNVALISDALTNPGTTSSSNTSSNSTGSNSTGSNSTGSNSTGSNSTSSNSLVVDGTCSVCLPNFYGVNSGVGCVQCGCNQDGSAGLQCNETGQCPCKDSVTGLKCDVCKDGFFGFSSTGCSACNCSHSGSTDTSCNQATGVCACKTNVQGDKCMECKNGFFNLAAYNPDGCQPCFCYGHGGSCNSSQGFEAKVLQVTNLTSIIQSGPLLGDHHISYGLNVTVFISAGYLLDLYDETLISLTGNGKTIYHRGINGTVVMPGKNLEYVVQLFELNWILLDKLQVPTALEVMGILAEVTEVSLISRAKGQTVSVTYMELQSAEPRKTGGLASDNVTFVEQCICNSSHHVAGLSCEKCATGYRRENLVNISSYDFCTPCDCGGRGATDPPECEEQTGLCLNCRNGTMGEHCEKCAPFVVGDDCDNCSSEYWGLQADGCRACNCSNPGSLSQVCDPQLGQCTCASHVTGRTCDQCEENYQGMTSTGCVECDVCYSLMKVEIVPLRQLTSNVASNVTLLEARNVTGSLGPFMFRLTSAVHETEQLVNFLSSVNQSSSQIDARITALNQTLESVLGQMSDTENATESIEQGLTSTDTIIKQAISLRTAVETTVTTVYFDIANLQTSALVLSGLARSIKLVESYLESLANASTADQEIIAYLASLNQTVSTAGQLTSEVSQKSQEASRVHQSSSGNLLLLETMIISALSKITGTSSSARSMALVNTMNTETVKRLQELKAELINYIIDYVTITSRTRSAQAVSSSYQSQVTAEASLFTPSNLKALQSVSLLEPFINGTHNLSSTASLLLWRSNNTQQQSSIIQNEAQILMGSAQAILATAINFSAQATDMKQRANQSLSNLATLNNQSQTLITQATNLTDTLVVLKQNVSATKETSQQALLIIQDKQQKLLNVSNQADKLRSRLQTTTDISEERYRAVNNTAINIVTPGQQLCVSINNSVTNLRNKLSMAESTTSEAMLKVSNVTERANLLLAGLKGIQNVNTASIVALVEQVSTARSNVNVDSLRTIVSQLQVSRNIQRTEIDRLTALRDTLRVRVQSLQLLQGQITRV